jgi:response regulator of citrate/malate metabolism
MANKKLNIYQKADTKIDYRSILLQGGYEIFMSSNWKEVYLEFIENLSDVVVIELYEKDSDSKKLLEKLISDLNPPCLFILSPIQSPDIIVDLMKKGIADFMNMPVNSSEFASRLEKVYGDHEIERTLKNAEKDKIKNLESQLQWYSWEERARSRDKTSMRESLFHSLQLSFNRPAGIGALVTLMELIGSMADKEGDRYIVDADIFDAAVENGKISQKTIDIFSGIDYIVDLDLNLKIVTCNEIEDIIRDAISEVEPFIHVKNNTIITNHIENCSRVTNIHIERERFKSVVNEVLVNALKFSKDSTKVLVISHLDEENFNISVFNEPVIDEDGHEGVPTEFEDLVFEPFFRITKKVNESYKTLEVGLGLTLVEKVIKKHNGKVKISNIKDYSDISRDPVTKVHLLISLPLS